MVHVRERAIVLGSGQELAGEQVQTGGVEVGVPARVRSLENAAKLRAIFVAWTSSVT